MTCTQAGFGMLEALLALAIGLVLLGSASHVFVSTYQAWQVQAASARLQDDARLALQRMAQDIRSAGMLGCLRHEAITFDSPAAAEAFTQPVRIARAGDGRLESLSLVGEQLPGTGRQPDWILLTDCLSWAQVRNTRDAQATTDALSFPIQRVTYQLQGNDLRLVRGSQSQTLIDQVRDLRAALVATGEGGRVDVQLTLFDPRQQVELRHEMSVALRNRLPES